MHLAFQLAKRPNLTKVQQDLILEGIAMAKPDAYDLKKDRTNAQSAIGDLHARIVPAFERKDAYEIFASMGGDEADISMLEKYRTATSSESFNSRRLAFGSSSAEDRSTIMKAHLANKIANSLFSKEQNELIIKAIGMADPSIYSAEEGTAERRKIAEALTRLTSEIEALFDKRVAAEIFMSLGGNDTINDDNPSLAPYCSCAGESDYCGWWHRGSSCGAFTCQIVQGCGTLLAHFCIGQCSGRGR